jgi:hypothetical protein
MKDTVKSDNKSEIKLNPIQQYDKEYWDTHLKWTFQNL